MYQSLIDGSGPGTVPTKKYPGNRAFHKGSSATPRSHGGHEKPYKRWPDGHSPGTISTSSFYKGVKLGHHSDPKRKRAARKRRRMLAEMKIIVPVNRKNPKKNRSERRPRCVQWPSELKPSPRYRYDGTVKKAGNK